MENEEAPDELPPPPPGALLCNFKIEVVELEEDEADVPAVADGD